MVLKNNREDKCYVIKIKLKGHRQCGINRNIVVMKENENIRSCKNMEVTRQRQNYTRCLL